jgi:hypothetical protein
MKTKAPQLIEIFKSGQHTAMSGVTISFSESDIAATAASYNPALHEAPLVVGHPAADLPAYGWVSGLQFADGVLSALPSDVDPEFAELVNMRRFGKISASFYEPTSPNNPVPGVYYLRHVGFLGAQPPAVKGLRSPQFASDDTLVICFECSSPSLVLDSSLPAGMTISPAVELPTGDKPVMTPEQIAAKEAELQQKQERIDAEKAELATKQTAFSEQESKLHQQLAKTKATELDTLVGELIKEGRVLPKDKNGLIAFMSADKPTDVIEFAENGAVVKQSSNEWLVGFLKSLPVQVDFAEVAGSDKSTGKPLDNKTIARRAQAYKAKMDAQGVNLSYAEAVDGVLANEDGATA